MPFAKVVISEIQRDSSLKIFELSAECVRQPRESAAVHPQRMVLFFNVAGCDVGNIRHSLNNGALDFNHFRRAIPDGRRRATENGDCVGFYELPIINLTSKAALDGIWIGGKSIAG